MGAASKAERKDAALAALIQRHKRIERALLDLLRATEDVARGKYNDDLDDVFDDADAALGRETPDQFRRFIGPVSRRTVVQPGAAHVGGLAAWIGKPSPYAGAGRPGAGPPMDEHAVAAALREAAPEFIADVKRQLDAEFPIPSSVGTLPSLTTRDTVKGVALRAAVDEVIRDLESGDVVTDPLWPYETLRDLHEARDNPTAFLERKKPTRG